jgi:hypothetical protein
MEVRATFVSVPVDEGFQTIKRSYRRGEGRGGGGEREGERGRRRARRREGEGDLVSRGLLVTVADNTSYSRTAHKRSTIHFILIVLYYYLLPLSLSPSFPFSIPQFLSSLLLTCV